MRHTHRGTRLRALIVLLAAPLAGCVGSDGARAQGPEALETLLQAGEYGEAIERLERALGDPPAPDAALGLAELLRTVGRLGESERVLEDALAATPGHPRLLLLRGRLLLETGRLADALETLRDAEAAGTGGDALLARMHAGEVLLRTGEREEALGLFDSFIDVYNRSASLDARGLVAIAQAVRRLETTDSALLRDALRAFDEALALDPDNLEAHLGIGSLFVRTYQIADAQEAFREVLTRRSRDPRALLGVAEALQVEGSARAGELVDQALEVNPNLVAARVLRARIRFAAEDLEGAEEDLEAALEVDPTSSAARAVLAAMHFAGGRQAEFDAVTASVLALNPHDAGYFVTVAELAATRRYYAEAAAFAARGVGVDSLAWSAYGTQGLNQLRVGEMAGGRENLETAFGGDPYNLWFKNTLDLLDVMDGFETAGSERIQVFVDPEDGQALALYLLEVSERAYETLSERYGHWPRTPLRVEAFRRSADFSVRTVGLAGLGALGVAFGRVVAMDSPSARGPGGYHWASTLWHEMAHVVHLEMTGHRVPRWLSEGLAVHEERLAGPGWGSRPGLPFLASYLDGRFRPPSELSQSFVRPRFPEEIGFAYVLGSLVSEWVESEWGFAGIRGMLTGYGEGLSHREVLEREFGLGPGAFDAAFDEWVRERYPGGFAAADAARELREIEAEVRGDPEWLEERVAARPEDVESRPRPRPHPDRGGARGGGRGAPPGGTRTVPGEPRPARAEPPPRRPSRGAGRDGRGDRGARGPPRGRGRRLRRAPRARGAARGGGRPRGDRAGTRAGDRGLPLRDPGPRAARRPLPGTRRGGGGGARAARDPRPRARRPDGRAVRTRRRAVPCGRRGGGEGAGPRGARAGAALPRGAGSPPSAHDGARRR